MLSSDKACLAAPAKRICVLIPAYNEADRIASTIASVRGRPEVDHIVVVDDGSTDETAQIARKAGADTVLEQTNQGKGAALTAAFAASPPDADIVVLLDADLGSSASECVKLIRAVGAGDADMAIGMLPPDPDFAASGQMGGVGGVTGLALWAIRRSTGQTYRQPLSGQRALRREVLETIGGRFQGGYGAEVALTIDVLRAGYRIMEVETHFRHRVTGSSVGGWLHRFRQLVDVARVCFSTPKSS